MSDPGEQYDINDKVWTLKNPKNGCKMYFFDTSYTLFTLVHDWNYTADTFLH